MILACLWEDSRVACINSSQLGWRRSLLRLEYWIVVVSGSTIRGYSTVAADTKNLGCQHTRYQSKKSSLQTNLRKRGITNRVQGSGYSTTSRKAKVESSKRIGMITRQQHPAIATNLFRRNHETEPGRSCRWTSGSAVPLHSGWRTNKLKTQKRRLLRITR